jgi:hypothetical protein
MAQVDLEVMEAQTQAAAAAVREILELLETAVQV